VLKDHKPRVLLDAVGDQITADLFFAMPRGAVWVSYGKMGSEAPQLTQMGQFIFMDKRIEGFWLSTWLPAKSAARRAELIARCPGPLRQRRLVHPRRRDPAALRRDRGDPAGLSQERGQGPAGALIRTRLLPGDTGRA
jgi:NADPH:quinone reductase-like Zn-dependent oxidoreductase